MGVRGGTGGETNYAKGGPSLFAVFFMYSVGMMRGDLMRDKNQLSGFVIKSISGGGGGREGRT